MNRLGKENIIINYSESLDELAVGTMNLLNNKINEYKELFNIDNINVEANYFDDLDEFRNFIYEIRGEKESLPEYARGTFDKGMINAYVDKENQMKRLYTGNHELFHILYNKCCLNGDSSKRIVWYDEGMAQLFSGEKNGLNDIDRFKNYYLKVKESTISYPLLNEISHGKTFVNDEYNAYALSYLSVRYLYETLDKDDFKSIMSDTNRIKSIGENVLSEMFNYYDEKFNIKNK